MSNTQDWKIVESRESIENFLSKLRYTLKNDPVYLLFEEDRAADVNRGQRCTNRYTINDLFPNSRSHDAIKVELQQLTVSEYVESMVDRYCSKQSMLRVFVKMYNGNNVYIKFRFDMISTAAHGQAKLLVISFHYAEFEVSNTTFPYR